MNLLFLRHQDAQSSVLATHPLFVWGTLGKDQSSRSLKELFRTRFPKYWSQVHESDPIWQPRYYGFNIWSRQKVEEKLDYMHMNPVRAGLVEHPTHWLWSSARWYLEGRTVGLPIRWPPGLESDG